MEPVVGIFPSRAAAERAATRLRSRGFDPDRIQLLLPGKAGVDLSRVPEEEAEQPGVGQAVGGVVGGAAGASAGFGIGAATALLIPGVGHVTAVGLAAAALFGAAGAAGGGAAGEALEEKTRAGLPRDEIYLYEDALAHGKSIVFATPASEDQVKIARDVLEKSGAESLDAAREAWWVGIREAEKAHYQSAGRDFDSAEVHYRCGFLAAFRSELQNVPYEAALPAFRKEFGEAALDEAFRKGYERGAARAARRREELEPAGRGS